GLLGQRLGEMHVVLSAPTDNPDFKTEVTSVKDSQASAKSVSAQVERALDLLEQHRDTLEPADQQLVSELLGRRKPLLAQVQALAKQSERRAKYSPFKDVSGVLRSFDYAAAMAMRNAQSADTSPEAAAARQHVAETYLSQARAAFLDGYKHATGDVAHVWKDAKGEAAALALFTL
nr:hypothetical protein [Tanacetum cinerariifolium]